jgi:3-phosphoshikimate 1-carboxyvinyltransferase
MPQGPLPIVPLRRAVELTWPVPGSKSITNRALVLAALADGRSTITGVLHSDDTRHMRSAIAALGIPIRDLNDTTLVVDGGRNRLRVPAHPLFVGNSGTTVRFLAALACLVDGSVTLTGDDHMATRPIADLTDSLKQLGVTLDSPTGCPPLTIHGGRLPGGVVTMRGDRSSQYFSALMMAGSLAEADLRIRVVGQLVSRPYVEITRSMVADFGGAIDVDGSDFVVRCIPGFTARPYRVEPDASSASYAFALAAAGGGAVTVPGLGRHALQGDHAFVDILERAGARVSRLDDGTVVSGTGRLQGVEADMHHISDTAMTLAAIAATAQGPTTIRNVANIRIKETDRLVAMVTELRRLGQGVEHGDDWLRIDPRPVTSAVVRTYGDHRMAMSFAILGLLRPGISIDDPACVAKTYPTFWDDVAECYRRTGVAPPWPS